MNKFIKGTFLKGSLILLLMTSTELLKAKEFDCSDHNKAKELVFKSERAIELQNIDRRVQNKYEIWDSILSEEILRNKDIEEYSELENFRFALNVAKETNDSISQSNYDDGSAYIKVYCRSLERRDNGQRYHLGALTEFFENSTGETDNTTHMFFSASFPALFVFDKLSKNKESVFAYPTMQGELDWSFASSDDGFYYKENELYGSLGFYLPFRKNGLTDATYYNPYDININTLATDLYITDSESSSMSTGLDVFYQRYDGIPELHNTLIKIGGGYVFNSEDSGQGINAFFALENLYVKESNVYHQLSDVKLLKPTEIFFPRFDINYFKSNDDTLESVTNSSLSTSLRWITKFKNETNSPSVFQGKQALVELTFGYETDIGNSEDDDGIFGYISLSIENNIDFGRPDRSGSSRGRRSSRRP